LIREEIVEGLLRPMRLLAIAVPPALEGALGYDRPEDLAARFVAFYWSKDGQELLWDDGRNTSSASWLGWQAYFEHPTINLHFLAWHRRGVYFGGKGAVASHYFLLDRKKRRAYIGNLLDVVRLLSLQQTDSEGSTSNGTSRGPARADCLSRKTLSQLMETLNVAIEQASYLHLTPAEEKQLPEVKELERRVRMQRQQEIEMVTWLEEYSDEYSTDESSHAGNQWEAK
jgi:hypothetical protein